MRPEAEMGYSNTDNLLCWPTIFPATFANLVMSECGTCSHAVIPSLGARSRGGLGRAPAFRVARCQIGTQVGHL